MPLALVTNDDGITSYYLRALVLALQAHFDVVVAAPKREQSWIGRAMSRHTPVQIDGHCGLPCPGWCIHGTPSDCVNIAMDHLLPQRPDIVVSGINIGFNTTVPLILCSGTVAGAIEGSVWGVHGVAVSQLVPKGYMEVIRGDHSRVPPELEPHIHAAARHAAAFALDLLPSQPERLRVHNLNYPNPLRPDAIVERTVPGDAVLGGLFGPIHDAEPPAEAASQFDQIVSEQSPASQSRTFSFRYQYGQVLPNPHRTDRAAIAAGNISHSVLDFGRIGVL